MYTRYPGGDGTHEGRRGIHCPATGNIDPHAVEGRCLDTQYNAGVHLLKPEITRALAFVEAFDTGLGLDETFNNLCIDEVICRLTLIFGDRNIAQFAVFFREVPERGIALVLYPPDDPGNGTSRILKAGLPCPKPCIDLDCLPHSSNIFGNMTR